MNICPTWTAVVEHCIEVLTQPQFDSTAKEIAAKQLRAIAEHLDTKAAAANELVQQA